ncbi:hypothetical protein NDN08_005153 [Rhodosorus marinus]|uniref:tRNA N(3)-methylcytidine methyltransferase n=1 Tax=Rhodosorus marinus TaxID=101924 RepID=A0AAV8V120_9RHOD|nr:hypothetical protein NDN08_005153 [Rhodosorus marinus]
MEPESRKDDDDNLLGWGLDLEVSGTREKRVGEWKKPAPSSNSGGRRTRISKKQFGSGEDGAWDKFYAQKGIKFFKDRHNLRKFFPELLPEYQRDNPEEHHPKLKPDPDAYENGLDTPPADEVLADKLLVVEAGCGVGNACFPLLRANPEMFMFSFDFSKVAVDFLRSNAEYDPTRVFAFVGDLTKESDITSIVGRGKASFVTMIWVLSALTPESMPAAVLEANALLKKGGSVLLRDYAVGDLAQIRKCGYTTPVAPGLLRRGDGTIAYFFDIDGLKHLFESNGFKTEYIHYVDRQLENRKREIQMYRRWIQAKFEKIVE